MKRVRSIFLLIIFAAVGIVIGCGARRENFAAMKGADDRISLRSDGVYAAEEKSAGVLSDAAPLLTENRKLIRTGHIRFEVSSLAEAKAATEAWAKRFGGYVSDFSEDERSLGMTVHIPSAAFDDAMASSGGIGKILSKSADSVDVTDRFYDLDSRLATRRVLLERLQSYLRDAKNIKDMLEIEMKINDVTAEIEEMQGQFNRLSKQIELAVQSRRRQGLYFPRFEICVYRILRNRSRIFYRLCVRRFIHTYFRHTDPLRRVFAVLDLLRKNRRAAKTVCEDTRREKRNIRSMTGGENADTVLTRCTLPPSF